MIVYQITNRFDGRSYIGQTRSTLHRRWKRHLSDALSGSQYFIHCAIRKYGPDAFEVKKLEVCSTEQELIERECFYILHLGTKAPNGYNLTDGGEGLNGLSEASKEMRRQTMLGRKLPEETRRKISASLMGKSTYLRDEEHKLRMSAALTGKPRPWLNGNKHSLGYKHSLETKAKMSAARAGVPMNPERAAKHRLMLIARNKARAKSPP